MKEVKLIKDGDDVILPLSDDMMKTLGTSIGDTLQWIDNRNGSFTICKLGKYPENAFPWHDGNII